MFVFDKRLGAIALQTKYVCAGITLMPCFGIGIDLMLGEWDKFPQAEVQTKPGHVVSATDMTDITHGWRFKPNFALRLGNILIYLRRGDNV